MGRKGLLDLLTLAGTQHPVIDENTGQLIADRTMRQSRCHRRIHPTAQGTNHPLRPDLLTNLLHSSVDIRAHRPGRFAAADVVDKILENRGTFGGMGYLGVKLQTINTLFGIMPLHRRNGRIVRMGNGTETWRHPLDAVPVRHPHHRGSTASNTLEEIRAIVKLQLGPAKFSVRRFLHFTALEMRHQLHPIADSKYRDALIKELFGDFRGLLVVDTRGTA